jgi:hypothetical protein
LAASDFSSSPPLSHPLALVVLDPNNSHLQSDRLALDLEASSSRPQPPEVALLLVASRSRPQPLRLALALEVKNISQARVRCRKLLARNRHNRSKTTERKPLHLTSQECPLRVLEPFSLLHRLVLERSRASLARNKDRNPNNQVDLTRSSSSHRRRLASPFNPLVQAALVPHHKQAPIRRSSSNHQLDLHFSHLEVQLHHKCLEAAHHPSLRV